jgi:hypothetical protein
VQEAGVQVLEQPFFASGNVATAGGCLASPYLAAWIIARTEGVQAAASALNFVAPVGEKDAFVANALRNIEPCLASTPQRERDPGAMARPDVHGKLASRHASPSPQDS